MAMSLERGRVDTCWKTVFLRAQNSSVMPRSKAYHLLNDNIIYKLQGGKSRLSKQDKAGGKSCEV